MTIPLPPNWDDEQRWRRTDYALPAMPALPAIPVPEPAPPTTWLRRETRETATPQPSPTPMHPAGVVHPDEVGTLPMHTEELLRAVAEQRRAQAAGHWATANRMRRDALAMDRDITGIGAQATRYDRFYAELRSYVYAKLSAFERQRLAELSGEIIAMRQTVARLRQQQRELTETAAAHEGAAQALQAAAKAER